MLQSNTPEWSCHGQLSTQTADQLTMAATHAITNWRLLATMD